MRVLIYLLAMLTGFSAAEAARPVAEVPASSAVGQAYADVAVAVTAQTQLRPIALPPTSAWSAIELAVGEVFSAIISTTPVVRHDVIRS